MSSNPNDVYFTRTANGQSVSQVVEFQATNIAALRAMVDEENDLDDIDFGTVGDANTTLIVGYATVDATCVRIKPYVPFPWGKRHVYVFKVFEPTKYAGVELSMYVRVVKTDEQTKKKLRIAESSKLYKITSVAAGFRVPSDYKPRKTLWLNRNFRCRLKTVTYKKKNETDIDVLSHTIVETIVKVL